MEKVSFFEHNPIKSKAEDIFGRTHLSELISQFLLLEKNQDSIVFSIESEWGQGKTSLINLIKFRIYEIDPNAILISFNPWIVGNLSSILESFFLEFAAAIGGKKSNNSIAMNTAKRILKLAKFLQPIKLIPGVEPWGTLVESTLTQVGESTSAFASDVSLEEKKREVEDSLQELNRPIVVIIDDIDRLQPEEARIIFQLTKAIANFKRVSYLLAYDPTPIIKVLSYGDVYDGRRYLEKIIQIKFQLPPVSYINRKTLVQNGIEKIRKSYPKSETIDEELLKDFVMKISRCKFTPRQLIQTFNSVSMLIFRTKNEVHLLDAFVFMFIETLHPNLTTIIRKSPHKYIVNYRLEEENLNEVISRSRREGEDETLKPRSLLAKELKEIVDVSERDKISELIDFIFPELMHDHSRKRSNDIVDARLNTKDSLYKLLSFGAKTSEEFSNEEATSVLSNIDRSGVINHAVLNYDFPDWIYYISNFFKSVKVVDPKGLINNLVTACNQIYLEQGSDFYEETAIFINSLIANGELHENESLFEFCIKEASSLSITENLIVRALRSHGLWKNGTLFDSQIDRDNDEYLGIEFLKRVKDVWLERISRESNNEGFFQEPDLIGILFRWGQLEGNSYKSVQEFLLKTLTKKENALIYVANFHGGKGVDGIEKLVPSKEILEVSTAGAALTEPQRLGLVKILNYYQQIENANKSKSNGQENTPP
jgi:KAP-like P-loop domain-containing protein